MYDASNHQRAVAAKYTQQKSLSYIRSNQREETKT